ncbi:septum formation initiator family protein [Georgenia sp. H159]|uniref:septum formation initiator family protein n=1 Tax=Georgenia sp. H159 TaxID=3076115 RepID=UPI002D786A36|nr:septum formation initiator family protein [Georgenia sp. H159]
MTARRPTGRRGTGGAARPQAGRPASAGRPAGARRGRPPAPARPGTGRTPSPSRQAGSARPSPAAPVAKAARGEPQEEATSPTITLRGLGLFVVVLVAFIVLAPTLRHAVEQQEQLRQLGADIEAAEKRTSALEFELEQWQDETFVRAQARDRLGYVMPGEQTFRVVDPETVVGEDVEAELSDTGVPGLEDAPWYLSLWESVTMAGQAAPGAPEGG